MAKDIDAKFQTIGANSQRISRLPILSASGACIAFLHRGVYNEMLATSLRDQTQPFNIATDKMEKLLSLPYPLRQGITYGQFVRS
ncbi:MAG: hypothetical protein QOH65_2648, partial [Methylobacteriaceae bacterium]|nr:hypothetical protein [Methylobacteriaceae bacterium]